MQSALLALLFAATALAMPPVKGHPGSCAAIEGSCAMPTSEQLTEIRKDCATGWAESDASSADPDLAEGMLNCQIFSIIKSQELPCQAAILGLITKP
ncbi:hypothetical protein LTR27_010071 [Elasticomyces elasticus]|nr:hypothetical protein LTR27_010071 [Elasticomyces elasticus]